MKSCQNPKAQAEFGILPNDELTLAVAFRYPNGRCYYRTVQFLVQYIHLRIICEASLSRRMVEHFLKGHGTFSEPLPKYLQYSDGEYAGNMSISIHYTSNVMGYST
jgi:hypothetical protein